MRNVWVFLLCLSWRLFFFLSTRVHYWRH